MLGAFAPESRELLLGEIVERSGQTSSGAYRILMSLQQLGLVERDSVTKRFRIGARLYALGSLAVFDIRRVAMPQMERLRELFGYVVNLTIREGNSTVLVEILEAARAFHMASGVGSREPLYCTAAGKCFLAFSSTEARRSVLDGLDFVAYTPSTLTTAAAVEAELEQVRDRGFALDRGEYEAQGRCVAVPIFDRSADVCAALSLAGVADLLSPAQLPTIISELQRTAADLSADLGCPAAPFH